MLQEQEGAVEKIKLVSLVDSRTQKEDKYMLSLKAIGQGKYGKVYKAVHIDHPDKLFAVKVIELESEKIRQECLKQLEVIRHLPKSLNLVQIHPQHFMSKSNFYIFEEYCDGGTLHDEKMARKNNPYSEEEVFNLFFQVVTGFLDLRKANIFHEDIKPQNILIKKNLYKITDFGISQLAGKHELSVVRKGTLIYMPPQKLKNCDYVPTAKSEIFSLGVTLYEVIFGHHPFLKKKPSDYKAYLKMLQEAQLKSVDELKKYFPSASLSIDKLIRILLRMIDLTESKRLSLEELIDYVRNTQPFRSMKIYEKESSCQSKAARKVEKKKYEIVHHSKIMIQEDGKAEKIMQLGQSSNFKVYVEFSKIMLKLFREVSAYLSEGVFYAKQCKIYQFKKKLSESYGNILQVEYLELVLSIFSDRMFSELARCYNDLIFACETESQESIGDLGMEGDLQFVKNQFLKLFMTIEVPDKKELLTKIKQQQNEVATEISLSFQQIFNEISCVRVNFKEDILATMFAKQCPRVVQFVKRVLNELKSGYNLKFASLLEDNEMEVIRQAMLTFDKMESMKREELISQFQKEMKGCQQILEDDESNSDEFEVLELEDYE